MIERGRAVSDGMNDNIVGTFLLCAVILNCISEGDKATCTKLAKQVAPFWIKSIRNYDNAVSKSRKDAMKTPLSNFELTTQKMMESSDSVVTTLCLCVAVSLGALCGFKGDSFDETLSIPNALCVTQEMVLRVICIKKILLRLDDGSYILEADNTRGNNISCKHVPARGQLRQVVSELVPLGRLRMLTQIRQIDAALEFCVDQDWCNRVPLIPAADDVYASDVKIGKNLCRVNEDAVSALLPVSAFVLLHSLSICSSCTNGTYDERMELVGVMKAQAERLAAAGDSLFPTLLQLEKEWLSFQASLYAKNNLGKSKLCFTSALLREHEADDETVSTFVVNLQQQVEICVSPLFTCFSAELVQFRIGVAMWLGNRSYRIDKSKCLAQLVKTAKLNPQFATVYSFIGHYYYLVLKDVSRATKCYIKALAYDPTDSEAGISLSQIYVETGEISKARKLWSDVNILTGSHSAWSLCMSGQLNLCSKNYDASIQDFQKALELKGRDIMTVYSLSICYSSQDQNSAALKSLNCSLELLSETHPIENLTWEETRIRILCDLGEVERRMGFFLESYSHFDEICKLTAPALSSSISCDHIIAVKGFGDVCLALGYERLSCGWTRGAFDVITNGIEAIDGVLQSESFEGNFKEDEVLICLLKLRGDLCAFCRFLSPADNTWGDQIPLSSSHQTSEVVCVQANSYQWIISRLKESEENYRKVLSIYAQLKHKDVREANNDDVEKYVSLWYDIGSALIYQACINLAARGHDSGLFSTSYLISSLQSEGSNGLILSSFQSAMTAFSQGLLLQPSHSGCWNGAGICCYMDDSLREMCYVRSTTSNMKENFNANGYCNLGSLYVAHNKQKCSKECINALQQFETNPLHWLILGGLLEKSPPPLNLHSLSHHQRIHDAYTAALEVAKPVEGLLGIVVSYMNLHGFLSVNGELIWPNHEDWPLSVSNIDIRYKVEYPICTFLYRNPRHVLAWSLLAWSYVHRQAWACAEKAYFSLLHVAESTLSQAPLSFKNKDMDGRTEEENFYLGNIARFVSFSVNGIYECRRKHQVSSTAVLLEGANYPFIERFCPRALIHSNESGTTLFEDVVMIVYDNGNTEECCNLIKKRELQIMNVLHPEDAVNMSRIKKGVRWLQAIGRLSAGDTSYSDQNKILACLIPVCKLISEENNHPDESHLLKKCFVLNMLRVYPSGFLLLGRTLLQSSEMRNTALIILKLGTRMHSRNTAIVRMLGRVNSIQMFSAASTSLTISREMLSSTCSHDFSPDQVSPETSCKNLVEFSVEQTFDVSGANCITCVCPQGSVNDGLMIVSEYCDSVSLMCANNIVTGRRCQKSDRKDLLTALWLDPTNMTVWATLAGCIFSDVALGPTRHSATDSDEDIKSCESKFQSSDSCEQAGILSSGVFSNFDLMHTCFDIILHLCRTSTVGSSDFIRANKFHLFESSLISDWVIYSRIDADHSSLKFREVVHGIENHPDLVHVLDMLAAARSLVFTGSCLESIPQYPAVIRTLSQSGLDSKLLSKVLVEVGNLYSYSMLPEKACEQYTLLETDSQRNDEGMSCLTGLLCAVTYARKASVSKDHTHVTKARQYADKVCEHATQFPFGTASLHFVKALIWLGLSKEKKATQEIDEAMSKNPSIEVPF